MLMFLNLLRTIEIRETLPKAVHAKGWKRFGQGSH
jgi:hypothetical protein